MSCMKSFWKSINKVFRPLKPIDTTKEENMGRLWCIWKHDFLSFLKKHDENESHKNQWSWFLLKSLGPVGDQVYKDLYSSNPSEIKNLNILLRDLDLYFIFGSINKKDDEDIEKYIDSLMLTAIASTHLDPVNIVKEKILQDIKNCKLANKVVSSMNSQNINFESYIRSLNLQQITTFWKNNQLSASQTKIKECVRCGTKHQKHNCPAHRVQCQNCKMFNHFTNCCKMKYIENCTKCGTNHIQSRCLAFGTSCENCGKANHFSWLCQIPKVENCIRCGTNHSIANCPAQGQMCKRCNKPNHMEARCITKLTN